MTLTALLSMAAAFVFVALCLAAAAKDLTSFTIPNWISLGLVAAFPAACLVCGLGLPQAGISLACGAAALAVCVGLFAAGLIGGGDAKFLAACVLWMGAAATPAFLLFTALAGGVLSAALLMLRSSLGQALAARGPGWVLALADPTAGAPYGVAICVGALAAFTRSPLAAAVS
jgi:prepilin peptidase CpaA